MYTYLELLKKILEHGVDRHDRTNTGTRSVFGTQLRFDLAAGFPILTTKRIHWRSVVHELLWFISGDTNIKYLTDNGVTIWNEWADENGDLGPVYGHQWRSWPKPDGGTIDQLLQVQHDIRHSPNSRRLIVSAWNPSDVPKMKLPPCHMMFQFYVAEGHLSCMMTQRSVDTFLGMPFNIASYALLTMMMAQTTGLKAGELIMSFGDTHLYSNHFDQAIQQLGRTPMSLPLVELNPAIKCITKFTYDDIQLVDYCSHPAIRAQVAV